MPKCHIDSLPNGVCRIIDAKYGIVQGEYADEGFAAVAALKMGYELA